MELDSKIESLCHSRKVLAYTVAGLWIIMFGPALPMVLLDVFSLDSLVFIGKILLVFFFAFLSVYGIRAGNLRTLFALSCFTCLLLALVGNSLYHHGGWLQNGSFLVGPMILIGSYLLSILVMARHLWLMRKARIRDEKLAMQEG